MTQSERIVMFRTIVVASLLVATPAMAEDLLPAVRRHVVQLGSDTAPEANAAEAALLKMGPAILETLKSPAIKPFEEGVPAIKHRLSRIRKQLESQHSEDAAAATSITIDANKMPISQLLAALSKQSGNAIIDHRRAFGQVVTDREVSVKFDKTPFWQALDQALDAAPEFVMAHILKAYLYAVATEPEATAEAKTIAIHVTALKMNDRERSLLKALHDLLANNWTAALVTLDHHNMRFPTDLLDLQVGILTDFFRPNRAGFASLVGGSTWVFHRFRSLCIWARRMRRLRAGGSWRP